MIYLAEVHRGKTGFRGIAKSELKLLALQRSAKSWIPLQSEDAIALDQSHDFNVDVLVIVQINANRQVQHIQLATHRLLHILQTFSHQLEDRKKSIKQCSLPFNSVKLLKFTRIFAACSEKVKTKSRALFFLK